MLGRCLPTKFGSLRRASTMQITIWRGRYLVRCPTIQVLIKVSESRFRGGTLQVSLALGQLTMLETKVLSLWRGRDMVRCPTIQVLIKVSESRFRGGTLQVSLALGQLTMLETKVLSLRYQFQ